MASTSQVPPPDTATIDGESTTGTPRFARSTEALSHEGTTTPFARYVWALARIAMGWTFLWPFLDKMFGLGHDTSSAKAWLNGGNPTKGFLSGAVGPFAGIYQNIAGAGVVNVLFMTGLLGIGVALLLGIAMRPACIAGATMVILMWSASLPPANNPFLDEHIVFALLLIGLAAVGAGRTLGLGERWAQTAAVRRYPWLA
jgi:thiosulfate dehydrogenase [quinone] large subunit